MDIPNDKPQEKNVFEDPKLYVVVGKDKFPKLGLETAFVDFPDSSIPSGEQTSNNDSSTVVGGVICTCNKVRVKQSWDFPTVTKRESSSSGSSGGGSGCRCAPVH